MSTSIDDDHCVLMKYEFKEAIKIIEWKVKKHDIVSKGSILFLYNENGIEKKFRCNFVGTIVDLYADIEHTIKYGDDLLMYQLCLHPTVIKDLCAECGEDLRQLKKNQTNHLLLQKSKATVSMIHSVPELRISYEHAIKLGRKDVERLLNVKKLVLLVDLDQTLIHTTYDNLPSDKSINGKDIHHFQLYSSNAPSYHTKLRPHTNEFLKKISDYFELHICTFGARLYAHKIASILDPTGKFFSHRILSRDECFDPYSKTGNLKALFPCGDSMVCIIDDREDVWSYSPNVIAVKPYLYFKNTGDINSPFKSKTDLFISQQTLKKPDKEIENVNKDEIIIENKDEKLNENIDEKSEAVQEKNIENDDNSKSEDTVKEGKEIDEKLCDDKTENSDIEKKDAVVEDLVDDDEDDYLLYLEDILKRIHAEFYRLFEEKGKDNENVPEIKEIVPNLRKNILKGCNLVFSGVVPTNVNIEKTKIWSMATSLGATVSKDIVASSEKDSQTKTTHLIAAKYGTLKVNKALKYGIPIVNPLWLFCCSDRWDRVDERLFILSKDDDFSEHSKSMSKFSINLTEQVIKVEQENATTSNKPNEVKTKETVSYPVYDSVTGKRLDILKSNQNSSSTFASHNYNTNTTKAKGSEVNDPIEPHNMIEFVPLSAFSKNELQMMDKEVDDACSEGDEMSTGNTESSEDDNDENSNDNNTSNKRKKDIESSSEESLTNEFPKGWPERNKKKLARLTNDLTNNEDDETQNSYNIGSDSTDDNESIGSVDEEMAAAVEREFLQ